MNPTDITIPESMEELDALCDRWRLAMSQTFDFDIGAKKQNKLRDAVSQFLGFPNGFQQLKASFPEDLSKVMPYPDNWPEVIIFEEMLDEWTLHLGADDMTPLKGARIEELDVPGHPDLIEIPFFDGPDALDEELVQEHLGMSAEEADKTLMAHYTCERVIVKTPDVDKYGVSGMGTCENVAKKLRDQFGFESDDPMIEDEHYLMDTGDDSCASVYLKLVKKPKPI